MDYNFFNNATVAGVIVVILTTIISIVGYIYKSKRSNGNLKEKTEDKVQSNEELLPSKQKIELSIEEKIICKDINNVYQRIYKELAIFFNSYETLKRDYFVFNLEINEEIMKIRGKVTSEYDISQKFKDDSLRVLGYFSNTYDVAYAIEDSKEYMKHLTKYQSKIEDEYKYFENKYRKK